MGGIACASDLSSLSSCLMLALVPLGASRIQRGVRREQTGEVARQCDQGRTDQSTFVDSHRCERPDGKVVSWAIEGGTPNTLFRLGITKDFVACRNGDSRRWISGQRRFQQGQRQRYHADGWKKVFMGGSSPGRRRVSNAWPKDYQTRAGPLLSPRIGGRSERC